jgi:hypothetical protein
MKKEDIISMAQEAGAAVGKPAPDAPEIIFSQCMDVERFAALVASAEREAIYKLVMEAPFKEFDRQEEDFDGEAANAMKAMAFSLTSAIRARGQA